MTCRRKRDAKKFQFIEAKLQKKMKYLSKNLSTKSLPQPPWIFVKHVASIDKTESTEIKLRICGDQIKRETTVGTCEAATGHMFHVSLAAAAACVLLLLSLQQLN